MALYLIESSLKEIVASKEALDQKVSELQTTLEEKNAAVVEVQVSKDFSRSFFIVESEKEEVATETLKAAGIPVELVKEVRLIGKELDNVKKKDDVVNYLVEWNIPADI